MNIPGFDEMARELYRTMMQATITSSRVAHATSQAHSEVLETNPMLGDVVRGVRAYQNSILCMVNAADTTNTPEEMEALAEQIKQVCEAFKNRASVH